MAIVDQKKVIIHESLKGSKFYVPTCPVFAALVTIA